MTALVMAACFSIATMAQTPTQSETPGDTQGLRVKVNRANLRTSASTTGQVLAVLTRGSELERLETVGSWYRVRVKTSGQEGYMSNTVVEALESPVAAGAPTAPAPEPTPTGQAALPTSPAPAPVVPTPSEPPAPAPTSPFSTLAGLGIRVYGAVDLNTLRAKQSFDAVLGTSRLTGFGAGADVLNVWKSAFVRVAVSHASKGGSLAFVADGQAVSLGIPIRVSMTPVEVGGGWRFESVRPAHLLPYAGGGVLIQRYSEKSSFAGSGADVSQTNKGFTAFGGVEVDLSHWLIAGAEVQYRSVPNAFGSGSISQDFGESNLGGVAVRALFGLRR
jgi:hypothetical protein